MPSPIEVLLDPISLIVIAMYAGLMLAEHLFPRRELPDIPGWRLRGLAAFAVYFFASTYLPTLWDQALAPYQLLDLSHLGVTGGFVAAFLAYELGVYLWHRVLHASPWLFRRFHQMHHSAERIDVAGAFYFGALDIVGWSALGSLVLVLGVGVRPESATWLILTATFLGIFQHANLRTPHWLGYLVQRPESHGRHHARGHHRGNYSDLPLFDWLFGTLDNPADGAPEVDAGFYDGASARVLEMHLGIDVTTPAAAPMHAESARASVP